MKNVKIFEQEEKTALNPGCDSGLLWALGSFAEQIEQFFKKFNYLLEERNKGVVVIVLVV